MGHPALHHKINYVEFSATDVGKAKEFYGGILAGSSRTGGRSTPASIRKAPGSTAVFGWPGQGKRPADARL
jgi:hypothetical protein